MKPTKGVPVRRILLAVIFGAVIATAAPAAGVPSIGSLLRRLASLDSRERQHYANTGSRIRAAATLIEGSPSTPTSKAPR